MDAKGRAGLEAILASEMGLVLEQLRDDAMACGVDVECAAR